MRRVVACEIDFLGLWQNWAMFAPNPLGEDGQWEGPGELTDGMKLDVLSAIAPGMLPDRAFFFSRWNKYRSELYADSHAGGLRQFAAYLCRKFNRETNGAQLANFEMYYQQLPTHGPEQPPFPVKRVLRWHQICGVETRTSAPLIRNLKLPATN